MGPQMEDRSDGMMALQTAACLVEQTERSTTELQLAGRTGKLRADQRVLSTGLTDAQTAVKRDLVMDESTDPGKVGRTADEMEPKLGFAKVMMRERMTA